MNRNADGTIVNASAGDKNYRRMDLQEQEGSNQIRLQLGLALNRSFPDGKDRSNQGAFGAGLNVELSTQLPHTFAHSADADTGDGSARAVVRLQSAPLIDHFQGNAAVV